MSTFVEPMDRMVSSDTLTAADCKVGDVLVNSLTGAAELVAQNPTTGAKVGVPVGAGTAPSALETNVLKASVAVDAFRFIEVSGANLGKHAAPKGSDAVGVSKAAAAPGANISMVLSGIATVETGGLVNAGDKLTSDATGRAIQATSTTVDGAGPQLIGSQVIAVALGSAGGAGSFISVVFFGGFGVYPTTLT